MDSKEDEEKLDNKHPIYYMNCQAVYKSKSKIERRNVWVVSLYDDINLINAKDKRTLSRLDREYRGTRKAPVLVRVVKIYDKKIVGYRNGHNI